MDTSDDDIVATYFHHQRGIEILIFKIRISITLINSFIIIDNAATDVCTIPSGFVPMLVVITRIVIMFPKSIRESPCSCQSKDTLFIGT